MQNMIMKNKAVFVAILFTLSGWQVVTAEMPDFIQEGKDYIVPGRSGAGKVIKVEKIDHDWLYIVEKLTRSGKPASNHYSWVNINSDSFVGIMPCDDQNLSEKSAKKCANN